MIEQHRIRRGLNEWRNLPPGYRPLAAGEIIRALDVQKIHAEWFCEYPAKATLIGHSPNGDWYRREP